MNKTTINAICRKYGMSRALPHECIEETNGMDEYGKTLEYKGIIYRLKYYDGCFYPYITEL